MSQGDFLETLPRLGPLRIQKRSFEKGEKTFARSFTPADHAALGHFAGQQF
jgi:hypothetical protein